MRISQPILRWCAVATWIVALGAIDAARGEEFPKTPRLEEAFHARWIATAIVRGRIVVAGGRAGSTKLESKGGAGHEELAIRRGPAGRCPNVTYQWTDAQQRLKLEIDPSGRIHVLRSPVGDSGPSPVEFLQAPNDPLVLIVGSGEEAEVLRAESLWQMWIQRPDLCRQYLMPVMRLLGLSGRWDEVAKAIERALLESVYTPPERKLWDELVAQLADERFARRQTADRQLRRIGPLLLAYLENLDPATLDAEQHYRIRRIVRWLKEEAELETSAQVATWLAGDPTTWLALLERNDEKVRRLAAQRLESLWGKPLPFDPGADNPARQRQLERLREHPWGN